MERYQDLFIKDGKYVGDFEKMYQMFDDPWCQLDDGYFNSISRYSVIYFLNKFKLKSCVEFGCGLGKTMNFINSNTKTKLLGVDISETSIKKAKKFFPELEFKVDSIENILNYKDFDCFFFSEICWMLLENKLIDKIFNSIKREFKGKYLINNLSFYKGKQQYGREYFTDLNEFVNFCPFKLINKVEIENETGFETSAIFLI